MYSSLRQAYPQDPLIPFVFCDVSKTEEFLEQNPKINEWVQTLEDPNLRMYIALICLSREKDLHLRFLLNLFIENECGSDFHYGKLFDIVGSISLCSIFSEERNHHIPLLHILSKALPQRCQYRNLKEVCITYCMENSFLFDWIKRCIRCSLCGYYPESLTVISPTIRRQLIHGLNTSDHNVWINWIQENGYLLFYILKEHLVYLIKYDISLYETACGVYNWVHFENHCKKTMDLIRGIIMTNVKHREKNIFLHVEQELKRINATQIPHLNKTVKKNKIARMMEYCKKKRQIFYEKNLSKLKDTNISQHLVLKNKQTQDLIYTIATYKYLLPHITDEQWLSVLGLSKQGVSGWNNEMDTVPPDDFILINEYTQRCFDVQSIQVFQLPQHWFIQQYVALRLQQDSLNRLDDTCANHFICRSCRTFKAFIVHPLTTDINFYAQGDLKVVYDDENDNFFCGKKPQRDTKVTSSRNLQFFLTDEKRIRKLAREKRRKEETTVCIDTELIPVSMIGNMVQCYNKLYVLCPQPNCGRPCRFEFKKYHQSQFSCGRCQFIYKSDTICCGYCGRGQGKKSWKHLSVNIPTQGVVKMHLCDKHNHPNFHRHPNIWEKNDLFCAIEQQQQSLYG